MNKSVPLCRGIMRQIASQSHLHLQTRLHVPNWDMSNCLFIQTFLQLVHRLLLGSGWFMKSPWLLSSLLSELISSLPLRSCHLLCSSPRCHKLNTSNIYHTLTHCLCRVLFTLHGPLLRGSLRSSHSNTAFILWLLLRLRQREREPRSFIIGFLFKRAPPV